MAHFLRSEFDGPIPADMGNLPGWLSANVQPWNRVVEKRRYMSVAISAAGVYVGSIRHVTGVAQLRDTSIYFSDGSAHETTRKASARFLVTMWLTDVSSIGYIPAVGPDSFAGNSALLNDTNIFGNTWITDTDGKAWWELDMAAGLMDSVISGVVQRNAGGSNIFAFSLDLHFHSPDEGVIGVGFLRDPFHLKPFTPVISTRGGIQTQRIIFTNSI